jgi:hypothetical protein
MTEPILPVLMLGIPKSFIPCQMAYPGDRVYKLLVCNATMETRDDESIP